MKIGLRTCSLTLTTLEALAIRGVRCPQNIGGGQFRPDFEDTENPATYRINKTGSGAEIQAGRSQWNLAVLIEHNLA